ncbi:MAG TPA: hypothetical protein ENI87_06555 [bacterium]|nr:hypothetical protein [bacterium]
MTFSDDASQLEQSFRTTRDLLQKLLHELQARRAAWVSVRPDVLAPSSEIEHLSHELARQENLRAGLLKRMREALPTPLGARPDQLHMNVTMIAKALPPAEGRSLRETADAVRALARAVRTETTLGQRLLRFAQNAQRGLAAGLDPQTSRRGPAGYDQRAQNVNAAGTTGQLVDGRM